jgi:hypothetical protein
VSCEASEAKGAKEAKEQSSKMDMRDELPERYRDRESSRE